MAITLNAKQERARASKMERRALDMRAELWPSVQEEFLWDRKKAAGFTTMPRTMSYIMNIIDSLTKGQPAGKTYMTIWCRLFFPGVVELASENQMAFETGFTGERQVDTWRKRMRHLKELGFIDYKGGSDHEYQWVLVYNPHHVIQRLGNRIQERLRVAWRERANNVGAKDIRELPETRTIDEDDGPTKTSSRKSAPSGKAALKSLPHAKKATRAK